MTTNNGLRERIGYVYSITSQLSGLTYVGIHQGEIFDAKYFGSPMSATGLLKEYKDLWPSSNRAGYKVPSPEEFALFFTRTVLEWCDSKEALFEKEKSWIKDLDTYANGLNRSVGAGLNSTFGPSYEKHCNTCEKTTKWKSGRCYTCGYAKSRSKKTCSTHGITIHVADKCFKCDIAEATEAKYCAACEKVSSHRGGVCQACVLLSAISLQECITHGLTKFMGLACRKCISEAAQVKMFCPECDCVTSHNAKICRVCYTGAAEMMKHCLTENKTTLHRGEMCYGCNSRAAQSEKTCGSCGTITAHRGESCMKCSAKKSFSMVYCSYCETTTNHRGLKNPKCLKCQNANHHARYHKETPRKSCQICSTGGTP